MNPSPESSGDLKVFISSRESKCDGRGAARMEVAERMNQVLESWARSVGA